MSRTSALRQINPGFIGPRDLSGVKPPFSVFNLCLTLLARRRENYTFVAPVIVYVASELLSLEAKLPKTLQMFS